MKTIHVVAIESEASGAVDWSYSEHHARRLFDYYKHNRGGSPGLCVTRFSFEIRDEACSEEITREADFRMWHGGYAALERVCAETEPETLED